MIFPRSLVPVALLTLAAVGAAGCKDDPPPPTAEPATSASSPGKAKVSPRAPAPMAKVDPQTMKEYRADVCYFGTLSLRQARDAYLASLGKDEPSEKKIPNFGLPTPPAAGTATPTVAGGTAGLPLGAKPTTAPAAKPTTATAPGTAAAAAAKPADTSKPTAAAPKPATSGSAAAGAKPSPEAPKTAMDAKQDVRRPFDLAMRAQHDRNARACKVASDLKEPAMADVDAALAAFAPFAMDLAKDIGTTSLYYQREDYKKDEFKQGKELHKKLVASFAKLDELSEKLGSALTAWHKDHAPDASKQDEGEKLASAASSDAREVMLGLLSKKIDVKAHKERLAKLEKSLEGLKEYGTKNDKDAWSKNLGPSLEAFVRTLKDAEPKVSEKGVQQDAFLSLVTGYTNVIEAGYRALTRALIAKGQTLDPAIRPASPLVTRPSVPMQATSAVMPPGHP